MRGTAIDANAADERTEGRRLGHQITDARRDRFSISSVQLTDLSSFVKRSNSSKLWISG
jgi:hypothetical protein